MIRRCSIKATEEGYDAIMRLLLNHNAKVNVKHILRRTPIFCAAHNGHVEAVKLLLKYNTDMHIEDMMCETPFFIAMKKGHEPLVKILQDHTAKLYSLPVRPRHAL